MEAFRFYQDRKVTCWERTHFEVTAESYEEAVAESCEANDYEFLYDGTLFN